MTKTKILAETINHTMKQSVALLIDVDKNNLGQDNLEEWLNSQQRFDRRSWSFRVWIHKANALDGEELMRIEGLNSRPPNPFMISRFYCR